MLFNKYVNLSYSLLTMRFHEKEENSKFFLRFYLFIFRERGREGEREGEKY